MDASLNRRSFLGSVAVVAAAGNAFGQAQKSPGLAPVAAPPAPAPTGPFTLPPLPYAPEALEPSIDAETMRIHHGKHHAAYVNNLNAALAPLIAAGLKVNPDIDVFITTISTLPADKQTAVRNNGGGHANHSLFWKLLAPKGTGGEPSKDLVAAIDRDLGGMDTFKEAIEKAGAARFGSGWSWLIVTPEKKLAIVSTPNQDSPLMGDAQMEKNAATGTPIFGIDVWEHAYYLKYQNRRGDYLKAIWDVVNWNEVSARYAKAMQK
jgi:Fe-Mn family superoxide dismutase